MRVLRLLLNITDWRDDFLYALMTLFHQPFGRAGSSTDAYCLNAFEPDGVNLFRPLYQMTVGIDTQAFVVEHLAVGTLMATYKEDEIVA